MNNEILLNVNKLNKVFDGETKYALEDISLTLNKGEKAALIGPDGAGKTTFLRIIAGLIKANNQELNPVSIENVSIYKNRQKIKKDLGYMPQTFGLYEDLSVIENIELYAGLKNVDIKKEKETIEMLLEFFELFEFKDRLAGRLSGGMKQKLGLCCTLLSKPKLLLLDEPSVGVDPISRKELIKITDKLSDENKIGIIWATSYLDEAQYFKRVIFFSSGKKIYDGAPFDALKKMEGLCYHIIGDEKNIRNILYNVQKQKGIIDATIEGDSVRVVFSKKEYTKNFNYKLLPVEPIFADFVMDALGGQKPPKENKENLNIQTITKDAISALNLRKVYSTKNGDFVACDNISFKVKQGEIFGLLGPNGAGKSTTFKMLLGLISPTSGTSEIFGFDILKNPIEAKKNFGYMAQKFSLFGNLSVLENLNFFIDVYNKDINKKEAIENVIESFELKKYLKNNASTLPLGFKQRLALACAVIHNPPVLFLDEPTSGVDPISRREFWMRINNLVKNKTTVLVTTHFMDEAQFCNRICIVYRGKMLVENTPNNLKNSIKSEKNQNPTMEDAFIEIVKNASFESANK